MEENENNNVFEAKTVQSNAFRVLTEAMKEILTDTNVDLDSTGIKIVSVDASRTVLVHLKLDSKNFEYYFCPNLIIVGISMLNFFKLIKTMSNNDTLTLFVEKDDTNHLGIKIENSDKNSITNYKLNLMDINVEKIDIPPATFESVITIPSTDFQKICRDMHNLADTIDIKSVGHNLIFSCKGDWAEQTTQIGESSGGSGLMFLKDNNDDIVQGNFALKHLVLFTKCTGLCGTVELYLKNDYPLIVKYTVASLGSVKLCLAPQCQAN